MKPMDRARIVGRWEEVLAELADLHHLRVVDGDPAAKEDSLLAELAELEYLLTEDSRSEDDREAA